MYRLLFFLAILFIPILFSWWLFIPMALLYVYLAKLPYELVVVGAILDAVYYFGEGFLRQNQLTIFSLILILTALFLNDKIDWRKVI